MPLNANLMDKAANMFNNIKTSLYRNYGENPGKMLVHTGTLGWILSSLAQISAVVFNDKISPEQKIFLIPQEVGDAAANILSFYLVTSSIKNIASKLVSTGKLTTPAIKKFLEKNDLYKASKSGKRYIGNLNFDMKNLANFDEIAPDYKAFKNGVDVIASTAGSILSCNIITPILRNNYGAHQQKIYLAKMKQQEENRVKTPRGLSMNDYQTMVSSKYKSGGMKI